MSNPAYPHIDIELWGFEVDKIDFLLSLTDHDFSKDETWALISGARALCSALKTSMERSGALASIAYGGMESAVVDSPSRQRAA